MDRKSMGSVGNVDKEKFSIRKFFSKNKTFKWRIERFSSLKPQYYLSRPFEYEGFSWILKLHPKRVKKEKEYIELALGPENPSSLPPNFVLNTYFEFCVYDHVHSKHKKFRWRFCFQNTKTLLRITNMIDLVTFNSEYNGYLVTDNCTFGVKFLNIQPKKIDCGAIFERLSVQKIPIAHSFNCTCTWEDITDIERLEAFWDIIAGDHKWKLKLQASSEKKNNCIGLFFELVTTPSVPFNSELYVEFSFNLVDQKKGDDKKITGQKRFDENNSTYSLDDFISLEDFKDPSKGFLVDNRCIIKPWISIIGTSTRP